MAGIAKLLAAGDLLYALGDDGIAYRLSYRDVPTSGSCFNEYGGKERKHRREFFWIELPGLDQKDQQPIDPA